MTQYFYWKNDRRSYSEPFLEYWFDRCMEKGLAETPYGNPSEWLKRATESPEGLRQRFRGATSMECSFEFILDKSWSNGDRVCSLTLGKVRDPVILNRNQRTYSEATIVGAISATLLVGEPLRLEDITIYPDDQYPTILHRKVTHLTAGLSDVQVPEFEGWPSYNESLVDHGISVMMNHVMKYTTSQNGLADFRTMWMAYAARKHLPPEIPDRMEFCNMTICGVTLFQGHGKCPGYTVIFRNVEFRDCIIPADTDMCWCGVKMISCRFTRTPTERVHALNLLGCAHTS